MTAATTHIDPLALPPVPPPAPDDHPWRDRVVAALFCLSLAAPLAGAWVNRDIASTAFEKRKAAAWPEAPSDTAAWRAWPARFEAAFADRIGGRDRLIALHHWTKAVGFGVSPVANALIGRDGWIYFLGEDGKSLDRDYRGVAPYPDGESAAVATELKRRHDYLAARGIPYVVMIVPDKATIYPEHLPRWVGEPARETRLDRLYAALRAYPELSVLDLRPVLREGKQRERNYFKTDSHWNYLGATAGYRALAATLLAKVPGFPAVPASRPPYVPGVDFYSGDLAQLIGLPLWFREDDLAPFSKILGDPGSRCARRVDVGKDAGFEFYACDRPSLPTAVVYNDSMGIPLVPLLSENFRRVVYVSSRKLDPALIEREHPDVVIEEMVERTIHGPSALPMEAR